ncbi:MAG: hypothetical protein HY000_27185 [Planctomycetes bacterium]|nr:hypothetical protein [Planctomycetota bacterium]
MGYAMRVLARYAKPWSETIGKHLKPYDPELSWEGVTLRPTPQPRG